MSVKNVKINIFSIILKFLCGIFTAVTIISISTIISLNLTFVYKIIIDKYDLVGVTGVASESLMINYKGLINYLQNPFVEKLKFQDFSMSTYGEIHFYEVKRIFIMLIGLSIVFVLGIIIFLIICKLRNNKNYIYLVVKNLNLGANILIIFFITLIFMYIIDFSKAFVIFHKIFFKNDYWIFDPSIDPIINALPEDLFMIYGAIILGIIITTSIVIKIINKNMPRRVSSKK